MRLSGSCARNPKHLTKANVKDNLRWCTKHPSLKIPHTIKFYSSCRWLTIGFITVGLSHIKFNAKCAKTWKPPSNISDNCTPCTILLHSKFFHSMVMTILSSISTIITMTHLMVVLYRVYPHEFYVISFFLLSNTALSNVLVYGDSDDESDY